MEPFRTTPDGTATDDEIEISVCLSLFYSILFDE